MPSISYAITVHNELEELQRLVSVLRKHLVPGDEIVIQFDAPNTTPGVLEYLANLGESATVTGFALDNDFAAFKNNLKNRCRGDTIFQIDADEYPSETLLSRLRAVMQANPLIDVFLVPRINTVRGLTPEHMRQWNWQTNQMGWVNFPDYQTRIWRNLKTIFWEGRVHERLVGGASFAQLPPEPEYSLMHPKDIVRQERQNLYYQTLQD